MNPSRTRSRTWTRILMPRMLPIWIDPFTFAMWGAEAGRFYRRSRSAIPGPGAFPRYDRVRDVEGSAPRARPGSGSTSSASLPDAPLSVPPRALEGIDARDPRGRPVVRHRARLRSPPRERDSNTRVPCAARPRRRRLRRSRPPDRRPRDDRVALAALGPPGRRSGGGRSRPAPRDDRGRGRRRRPGLVFRRRARALGGRARPSDGRDRVLPRARVREPGADPPESRGVARSRARRCGQAEPARSGSRSPASLRGRASELRRPRRARRRARSTRPRGDRGSLAAVEADPEEEPSELTRLLARSPRLRAPRRGRDLRGRGGARGRGQPRLRRTGASRDVERRHHGLRHGAEGLRGMPDALRPRVRARVPRPESRSSGAPLRRDLRAGSLARPRAPRGRPRAPRGLRRGGARRGRDRCRPRAPREGPRRKAWALRPPRAHRGPPRAPRGRSAPRARRGRGRARARVSKGELRAVRGQSARADASLASVLGQGVGARGPDPMRTFPFLLADSSAARLRETLAPIPLPRAPRIRAIRAARDGSSGGTRTGCRDRRDRILRVLRRGPARRRVASVDELAALLAPPWIEARSGGRSLAAGAARRVLVRADLARPLRLGLGNPRPAGSSQPAFPGMARSTRRCVGLDASRARPNGRKAWSRTRRARSRTSPTEVRAGRLLRADTPSRSNPPVVQRPLRGSGPARARASARTYAPRARPPREPRGRPLAVAGRSRPNAARISFPRGARAGAYRRSHRLRARDSSGTATRSTSSWP
jgi:hypothetical protein